MLFTASSDDWLFSRLGARVSISLLSKNIPNVLLHKVVRELQGRRGITGARAGPGPGLLRGFWSLCSALVLGPPHTCQAQGRSYIQRLSSCFPGISAAVISTLKTAVLSKPQTLAVWQEEVGQGPLLMSLPSVESTAGHQGADA